jgi:hypothetical protein
MAEAHRALPSMGFVIALSGAAVGGVSDESKLNKD